MLDPQAHVLARSAIRFELIGYHDAGRFGRLLEKLAHEPLYCSPISSALDQNVEHEALLIDGAPLASSVFHLSRGMHRVEYAGTVRQFSILWLPADKQRYRPKYGLRPEFSSIF